MKKVSCTVLILIMAILLMNPLPSDARGGHRGSHGGGYRGGYSGSHRGGHSGWWLPWAVIGGAAVLAPYYYYAPPPVIIREQPPEYPAPTVTPSSTERVFVYPRQGQSEEQQTKDRYECHSWAVGQTGYDPTKPSAGDMPEARRNQMRANYNRAQDACFDGRGYTMK